MSLLWYHESPRHGLVRHFMFCYDGYLSFSEALLRTQLLPYLTPRIVYDVMIRASLLHEPLCRYPAREKWALR